MANAKKVLMLVVTAVTGMQLFAEDIAMVGKNTSGLNSGTCWPEGKAPTSDNDYYVFDYAFRTDWRKSATFSGGSLNLGAPSTSPWGAKSGSIQDNCGGTYTVTINDFRWWNGMWDNFTDKDHPGTTCIAGKMHIKHEAGSEDSHTIYGGVPTRSFTISADIDSDSDAATLVWLDTTGSLTEMDKGAYVRLTLSGDNSGYRGSFVNDESFGILVLDSATAIGDPSAVNPAAIVLATDAAIAISGNFDQAVTRGIRLKGDRAYFMSWPDSCSDFTVKYPISKAADATGKVIVRGGGRVTFDCAYSAGDVDVQAGTLVLGANLTLPKGTKIHVCDGACLVQSRLLDDVEVAVDDGGAVALKVSPGEPLEMDAETFAALPRNADGRIGISLTSPIAIPFSETNTIPVLKITGAVVSPEMFIDMSAKTYDLPTTWFTTTSEAGAVTVNLVARPVIQKLGDSSSGNDLGGAAGWSDRLAPHPGADYYAKDVSDNYMRTGGGSNIGKFDFPGETLTMVTKWIRDYAQYLTFRELRLHGGTGISCWTGGGSSNRGRSFAGRIRVEESATDANPAFICFDSDTTWGAIETTLSGRGSLYIYGGTKAGLPVDFHADSIGFTGHLLLKSEYSDTAGMTLAVTNGSVFGAAPAAATADAVRMEAKSADHPECICVTATEDVTVDTANRGWTIVSGALGAAEGKTLRFCPPSLTVVANLVKTGLGTLAMGCVTEAAGATLGVREGYLMPLTDGCCSAFDEIIFADGTGIALDASLADADLIGRGLVAKGVTVADGGKLKVELRNWKGATASSIGVKRAILTVPAGTPDLTSSIELVGRCAFKELTSETVGMETTYYATYSRSGLMVVVQ